MRLRVLSLALVLFAISGSAYAQTFTATLNGANEVPAGDPDGTGSATITFVGTTVNYTIVVNNIVLPPTGQHIHTGVAGVNGPVLITLSGTWVGNTLVGSTTASATDVANIVANPAGFYVNVHTTDFPGGAIRGQLVAAAAVTSGIPTASGWGLALLGMAIAVGALLVLRRA